MKISQLKKIINKEVKKQLMKEELDNTTQGDIQKLYLKAIPSLKYALVKFKHAKATNHELYSETQDVIKQLENMAKFIFD